ncbi:MAG: GMC oxidoreductase, partial [Halobacteriaceae archaeon]
SLFAEACEDLGIAIHSVPNARNSEPYNNRDQCVGYGTCQPVCPSSAKYSADSTIERASQKGAKIITQAPVQKLEHDKAGDEITAAVYISANNTIQEQEADEFIIACGGVETPRLLLLSSSSEYPDGLANSSGLVGKFFMDHLFAGVGGRLDMQTGYNEIGFNTSESHQFYDRQNGDRGAIKLEFLNYTAPTPVTNTPIEDALTGNTWGDELQQSLKEKYGNHIAVGALIEQLPNADNQIRLSKSQTDDHGNPVPVIDWNIDDFTKQTIKRANEIQSSILEALDADITWKIGPKDTGPAAHHMGTTRMGTDPNHSVVKPTLQTHDIDNLSIASSSVFPTAGAMNPTLTIAALALKTADHVDERL